MKHYPLTLEMGSNQEKIQPKSFFIHWYAITISDL